METADAVTGELDRVDEAVGTGTDESRELHGLEGLIARIAGVAHRHRNAEVLKRIGLVPDPEDPEKPVNSL
jgi:hypothetical protein